jgi:hypothetical protein
MGEYIRLYDLNAKCDSAFFLEDGRVMFYVSNTDKYVIHGKNLIIGSSEIIMTHMLNTPTARIEAAITDGSSRVKKMTAEKFLEGMNNFSFSLNVSIVLARHVMLTNNIIAKNMTGFSEGEMKTKEYSIEYYTILERIKQEYNKRMLPWLKVLIQEYESSLTFKRGEAFYKSAEPVQMTPSTALSDRDVEYPRGSVICEEQTAGSEMYILRTGSLDVLINGNKVATIDGSGTVIGEMALLLGEKRSATLKAKNNVVITRIRKEDLKEVVQRQKDFLITIARSLAKRHYYNIIKIGSINKTIMDQMVDKEMGEEKKASPTQKTLQELRRLKMSVEEAFKSKKADFIKDLVSSF